MTHLSSSYEELRGGYAIADATVSVERISPLTFLVCKLQLYNRLYISSLVPTYLLVLADVAGKLGYDEIDDVTTEDMALEVRMVAMQTFFENQMK